MAPLRLKMIFAIFIFLQILDFTLPRKKNKIRNVRWWNLAYSISLRDNMLNEVAPIYINPSLQPLTRKQRRVVTRNPGTIVAVAKGARVAIHECQFQFRNRRWNCPTTEDGRGGSIFGDIFKAAGTRETAFIYAVTAAGVTHSVARACSEGSIFTCSCGRRRRIDVTSSLPTSAASIPPAATWEWGGCSDNIEFGQRFSREFVDLVEKGRDLRYMMNLHNNQAGRIHVVSEQHQECKCHGMSGSCTVKTCWMRLAPFRQTGARLKDRFDGAPRVYQGNSGNSRNRNRLQKFNLLPVNPNHKSPGPQDLVYFEESPTFCDENRTLGLQGTTGRQCNVSSIGVDGCDLMCCGRGWVEETYLSKERCNCTFHWCGQVTCHICNRTRVRHLCL
uniref:Protein Wnt n=1 Tax=Platynereis dumerilii TaxID=6359 RepID=Q8MPL8_PLADU|nr:Wnt1 protein [Platynereis dumerilii]